MADGPGALAQAGRSEGRRTNGALRVRRGTAAGPFVNAGADVPVPGRGADGVEKVGAGVAADDADA